MIPKKVKVTSLEFKFDDKNQGFTVKYKYNHNYKKAFIDVDNARLVARCLTREANKFWEKFDALYEANSKTDG